MQHQKEVAELLISDLSCRLLINKDVSNGLTTFLELTNILAQDFPRRVHYPAGSADLMKES